MNKHSKLASPTFFFDYGQKGTGQIFRHRVHSCVGSLLVGRTSSHSFQIRATFSLRLGALCTPHTLLNTYIRDFANRRTVCVPLTPLPKIARESPTN